MNKELTKLARIVAEKGKQAGIEFLSGIPTTIEQRKIFAKLTIEEELELKSPLYAGHCTGFSRGFAESRGIDVTIFMNLVTEIVAENTG